MILYFSGENTKCHKAFEWKSVKRELVKHFILLYVRVYIINAVCVGCWTFNTQLFHPEIKSASLPWIARKRVQCIKYVAKTKEAAFISYALFLLWKWYIDREKILLLLFCFKKFFAVNNLRTLALKYIRKIYIYVCVYEWKKEREVLCLSRPNWNDNISWIRAN